MGRSVIERVLRNSKGAEINVPVQDVRVIKERNELKEGKGKKRKNYKREEGKKERIYLLRQNVSWLTCMHQRQQQRRHHLQ